MHKPCRRSCVRNGRWCIITSFYAHEKEYPKAVEAFKEAVKINPDSPDAHYNLGLLYQHAIGDVALAHEHFLAYMKARTGAEDIEEVGRMVGELEARLWMQKMRSGANGPTDERSPARL
jgi:tetratricopeptide (TPR) repeat protein